MRPIKYRAWGTHTKRVHSWTELLNLNLPNIMRGSKYTSMVLMQYTGIQDSTGRDIFEGDIVLYHDTVSGEEKELVISWNEVMLEWGIQELDKVYVEKLYDYTHQPYGEIHKEYEDKAESLTIISNIYERKE